MYQSMLTGCLMTMEDLERYKVIKDDPITASLGDLTLHTLTAPSGGPVMALVLKILKGWTLCYNFVCFSVLNFAS